MSRPGIPKPVFTCFNGFCYGSVFPYREEIESTDNKNPDPVKRKIPMFKCSECGRVYYDGDVEISV